MRLPIWFAMGVIRVWGGCTDACTQALPLLLSVLLLRVWLGLHQCIGIGHIILNRRSDSKYPNDWVFPSLAPCPNYSRTMVCLHGAGYYVIMSSNRCCL